MNEKIKPLFTPWKIRNVEIKNRIVMTSMGGTSIFGWMKPNCFDKESAKFLLDRAKENVGLILPGIAPIRDLLFGKWLYKGKAKFHKLKKFMEEFHKTGAKMFVQLTAGFGRSLAINDLMVKAAKNNFLGFLLKPIIDVSYLTAAPSVLPNRWEDTVMSRALTIKEIQKIVKGFGKVAKHLKDAGVDGVEVHAVHEGYLLDQFTTKYTNYRTDEYGGSFENRYRFPVEIVQEIKRVCGKDFPVSLRYSVTSKTKGFGWGAMPGENFTEIGRDFNESIKAAKYLQDAGYDMLNCDNGTYDAWYWAHPPGYMPDNCNLKDVSSLKKYVNIPVVSAGSMTIDRSIEAIKNGEIDAAGFARAFLTDKAWVSKLLKGQREDIMPCIKCHNACFNMAHYKGVGNDQTLSDNAGMARCALNPETMQSKKYYLKKTKKPKKIAIIGAGIGGMEMARILKIRGHNPEIFEKSSRAGGVFWPASTPSFKKQERKLVHWYIKQLKDLNIKINFNKEISDLKDLINNYDNIVVATGSKEKIIDIPGKENFIPATKYLTDNSLAGKTTAVLGGGLTGCEIALNLHKEGKTPIIIEAKHDLIATRGVCLANSSYLRDYFKLHNIKVYLNSYLTEINGSKLTIKNKDGTITKINADSVINAIGYTPNPIFKETNKVKVIGDAKKVGNLRTVIWNVWDVGMKI